MIFGYAAAIFAIIMVFWYFLKTKNQEINDLKEELKKNKEKI